MTATRNADAARSHRSRPARLTALSAGLVLAAVLSACGSSSATPPASTAVSEAIVKAPTEPVQGCTYAPGNKVPPGEPAGVQPPFPAFTTDAAGQAALRHIRDHGGTGLVFGYQLPSGTKLYAGPDASSAPVGTLPVGHSIQLFDPVLWTASGGHQWLVSFLACGGSSPYWVDVTQIAEANPSIYQGIANSISSLLKAAPYTVTGKPSALPVVVNTSGHFAWKDPAVTFPPARGEYVAYNV